MIYLYFIVWFKDGDRGTKLCLSPAVYTKVLINYSNTVQRNLRSIENRRSIVNDYQYVYLTLSRVIILVLRDDLNCVVHQLGIKNQSTPTEKAVKE